jgi:hypothetical protein
MTRVKFLTKAGLKIGVTRDVLGGTNKSEKKILKKGLTILFPCGII